MNSEEGMMERKLMRRIVSRPSVINVPRRVGPERYITNRRGGRVHRGRKRMEQAGLRGERSGETNEEEEKGDGGGRGGSIDCPLACCVSNKLAPLLLLEQEPSAHMNQACNPCYHLYYPCWSLDSLNSCPLSRHLGGGGGREGWKGEMLGVTEGAGLAVVSLAQSRKCAGDKAAMWQDVMDF
ncbi:hypothetical protein NQZ68_035562 [Dissostichus eleginoides]|nr:hypothetical protein NQZ68_035562 [Dissostichus eleginoides]